MAYSSEALKFSQESKKWPSTLGVILGEILTVFMMKIFSVEWKGQPFTRTDFNEWSANQLTEKNQQSATISPFLFAPQRVQQGLRAIGIFTHAKWGTGPIALLLKRANYYLGGNGKTVENE